MDYILRISVFIIFLKAMFCSNIATDDEMLDEIERAAFQYFWEESNSNTGMITSSTMTTGFGLTALAIGHKRNYHSPVEIESRVLKTIRFIRNNLTSPNGFYYGIYDVNSGKADESSFVQSLDTAFLLAGVLTVRQYFSANSEIVRISTEIYERVDYLWMLDGDKCLHEFWTFSNKKEPEGHCVGSLDEYSEMIILVLQGLGSPTHPIPAAVWHDFARKHYAVDGITFISSTGRMTYLYNHQYAHAWVDFRNKHDKYTNYFENSINVSKAAKLYCSKEMKEEGYSYNENLCYTWKFFPLRKDALMSPIPGTVNPNIAGGSIPFIPKETLDVLRDLRYNYTKLAWGKYGFFDDFNVLENETSSSSSGNSIGITMLMAENYRTGFVWEQYMKDPAVNTALCFAGFNVTCSAQDLLKIAHPPNYPARKRSPKLHIDTDYFGLG